MKIKYAKQNIWLAFFVTVWVIAGLEGIAESTNTMISLSPSGQQLERNVVKKNSEVQVSNAGHDLPIEFFRVGSF